MNCEEFETRFLAGSENDLSADGRAAREQHLAECDACRTLAGQLDQLDTALTRQLKAPALPADFDRRLAQRIQVEATVLSEAERAERKRQMQAEYEAGLAQLRRTILRYASSREGLGYVALAALTSALAWQFTPRFLSLMAAQGLSGANQSLLLAVGAGAIFLAIGLTVALRQTSRQQWSLR